MEREIKCPALLSVIDEKKYPNTANYYRLYGYKSGMMSEDWDNKGGYKTSEEVYKECIKQCVTWQKLLNFKGYEKGVLY